MNEHRCRRCGFFCFFALQRHKRAPLAGRYYCGRCKTLYADRKPLRRAP